MICLQDLVTTNLLYVAERGSENLLSGIIICDISLSNMAMGWTYGVRYLVNGGIFCLLQCHAFSPSDIFLLLLLLSSSSSSSSSPSLSPPLFYFIFVKN